MASWYGTRGDYGSADEIALDRAALDAIRERLDREEDEDDDARSE